MNYKNVINKLKKGIAIADRETMPNKVHMFNDKTERLLYVGARNTDQLEAPITPLTLNGLDGFGEDFVSQIRSGSLMPDYLLGWSTKSILALLILALAFKIKKLKKNEA